MRLPTLMIMIAALVVWQHPREAPAAVQVISPSEAAGMDGNSSASPQFDASAFRIQWSYPASDFGANKGMVTLFAARPDAQITMPQSSFYEQVEFRLSTTQKTSPGLSTVFAENFGPDTTLVFDGPLTVATEPTAPLSDPRPFTYAINMQKPFYFDPGDGNLLMEIIAPFGYTPPQIDDSHINDTTGFVFSFDATGAEGVRGISSTVFQFDIVAGDLVPLDIKPGGNQNPINLKSRGVLPVAVLSTPDFDAGLVDPTTVEFGDSALINDGGMPVAPIRWSYEDVNDDNLVDLALKFRIPDLLEAEALGPYSQAGLLTGSTFAGVDIVATDSIRIVPGSRVPEPTGTLLVLMGLISLAFCRRC